MLIEVADKNLGVLVKGLNGVQSSACLEVDRIDSNKIHAVLARVTRDSPLSSLSAGAFGGIRAPNRGRGRGRAFPPSLLHFESILIWNSIIRSFLPTTSSLSIPFSASVHPLGDTTSSDPSPLLVRKVIMVYQRYGFSSPTYTPINMGHASVTAPMSIGGSSCSKKRKAFDDLESYDAADGDYQIRPKLSLPRSVGIVFNGDAQFHPLPADVDQAMLAQLSHNRFTGSAGATCSSFVTPLSSSSSSLGREHKASDGSDYFSTAATTQYPDVEPYPSTSPSSTYGILGPAPGRHNSLSDSEGMDVDYGSTPNACSKRIHGPQCKSIPQLCVRYNDCNGSELWATCPDCGACSKADSSQLSSSLCYSP
uniref:Uncharacterized protein n=1 Tax=Ustilago esculenta TaxID=185366 RepID=A0A481SFJ6_9BASI|nr:hypothetical protein UE_1419 [Ustilago esculenta]